MRKMQVRWIFIELLSASFGLASLYVMMLGQTSADKVSAGILVVVFLGLPCMRWICAVGDKLTKSIEIIFP